MLNFLSLLLLHFRKAGLFEALVRLGDQGEEEARAGAADEDVIAQLRRQNGVKVRCSFCACRRFTRHPQGHDSAGRAAASVVVDAGARASEGAAHAAHAGAARGHLPRRGGRAGAGGEWGPPRLVPCLVSRSDVLHSDPLFGAVFVRCLFCTLTPLWREQDKRVRTRAGAMVAHLQQWASMKGSDVAVWATSVNTAGDAFGWRRF